MQAVFTKILNMSLTGSIVIAVVLLARLFLKRAPKIYSYALWAVVLFRLLCPLSITAGLSVLKPIPVTTTPGISAVSYQPVAQAVRENIPAPVQQQFVLAQPAEQPEQSETKLTPMQAAAYIWLAGASVMAAYSVAQYWILLRKLAEAVPLGGEIYLADSISSPFVMGILRPRIYLPSSTPMMERRFIVAHERHHIRRGDPLWKLLGYIALCLHWFNPLVWLAFCLAGKDMEMSCDEAVIKQLGEHIRADYSQALLRLATHKRIVSGMPLAFGEGDTKGRVMNMAKWKKPKLWVSIVCFVLCASILVACAVNPAADNTDHAESTTQQPEQLPLVAADDLEPVVDGSHFITDTELVQYGTLKMLLPSGFAAINEDDTVVLTKDSVAVGGIRHWNYPEFQPSDIVEWMKEEYGVPIGYMSGSSTYGNTEFEIFWDGNPDGLNQEHEFFIDGDTIYDVWYDQNLISDGIAERFLKTVAINAEPVVEVNPAEQAAFEKCRAVLDAVQSASCHIVIEQSTTSDSESHWSTANYYQDTGNWLKIVDVDPESVNIVDGEQYSLRMAFMVASGVRYSNEGKWGKAYTDIDWREDSLTFNDSVKPWLASFQWDDAVAYMDTLTDENGECIMLRVDEKYVDSDEYDLHYFVHFNFDPDGNFVNAQLQVNLFRENGLAITESIVSMDPKTVNAEIQKEYRRAIG